MMTVMNTGNDQPPAAIPANRVPPRDRLARRGLVLRPTTMADCEFVVDVERHPDNATHVEQWSVEQHRQALSRPGTVHWIIEEGGRPIGFAVLEDADDPNESLLLRRIAIVSKGRGYGRTAVLLLAKYCFEELGFHRLWLTVARGNRRARNLYKRLGFVLEGTARESTRKGDRYVSMDIMSMLDREYRAVAAPGGLPRRT